MVKRALLTLVVTAFFAPVPTVAQMDTLTPHLETSGMPTFASINRGCTSRGQKA